MKLTLTGHGRPLRFLALVVTGWVGLRIVLLWPQTGSLPDAIKAVLAPETMKGTAATPETAAIALPHAIRERPATPVTRSRTAPLATQQMLEVLPPTIGVIQPGMVEPINIAPMLPPPPAQTHFTPPPSRWSGSGWLMVRQGSGISTAPGGQIGGSQGGIRIAYTIDRRRRVAVFGRFVTPLEGRGREATIAAEWQPTRAPVRIVAEHRFAIDGGTSGPALGLVTGGELGLPAGFGLETYGQAGVIRRDRTEPYADGAARATRRIPGTPVSLGAGAWGAAQRGAARLDIGPSATVAVPIAGQRVRLAVDWRQRVAGDARPGSGVALTLGSDF